MKDHSRSLARMRLALAATYRTYVERCRKAQATTMIPNSSVGHAAVVIANLLEHAAETHGSIRLVSGELAQEVYGELTPLVRKALKANCDLKVVVHCEHDRLIDNPFFEAVRAEAPKSIRSLGVDLDAGTHFMLVGDGAYRVEVDDRTRKASACFNDQSGLVTPILQAKFDKVWEMAREMAP